MKKYSKAQLNAISRYYTYQRNKQALNEIIKYCDSLNVYIQAMKHNNEYSVSYHEFIQVYKQAQNLKTDSYVILLNSLNSLAYKCTNNPKAVKYKTLNGYLSDMLNILDK